MDNPFCFDFNYLDALDDDFQTEDGIKYEKIVEQFGENSKEARDLLKTLYRCKVTMNFLNNPQNGNTRNNKN
jgi:hypothetical protein